MPRISDYPDDPEAWPDLEDDLIPDPQDVVASGPYGDAFTYLHAARLTLDGGLMAPTRLMVRTAARFALRAAALEEDEVTQQEHDDLHAVAGGEFSWEDPEDLIETLGSVAAFVERRVRLQPAEE